MQRIQSDAWIVRPRREDGIAVQFVVPFIVLCILSAGLISWKPLQLSIVTVFLFAGPHNWMEFRFFLGRMPARWGRSKLFFSVGLGGVAVLTATFILLYSLGQSWYLNELAWSAGISVWNTVMLLWLCALVYIRGKQVRGRDWSWIFAAGFALCSVAWAAPLLFSLSLVYLHPMVALWFFDRELKSRNAKWRRTYHICLALIPVILVLMWSALAGKPNLDDAGSLSWRITQHAGAGILSGVSSHLLVATHVFLETIHYGVWLILIPVTGPGASVWRISRIPLAVHRNGWPRMIGLVLIASTVVTMVLWTGFAIDYATTRDIYFAFAIAHVLAEAPFLIRML